MTECAVYTHQLDAKYRLQWACETWAYTLILQMDTVTIPFYFAAFTSDGNKEIFKQAYVFLDRGKIRLLRFVFVEKVRKAMPLLSLYIFEIIYFILYFHYNSNNLSFPRHFEECKDSFHLIIMFGGLETAWKISYRASCIIYLAFTDKKVWINFAAKVRKTMHTFQPHSFFFFFQSTSKQAIFSKILISPHFSKEKKIPKHVVVLSGILGCCMGVVTTLHALSLLKSSSAKNGPLTYSLWHV